jgi:hypothetical protein
LPGALEHSVPACCRRQVHAIHDDLGRLAGEKLAGCDCGNIRRADVGSSRKCIASWGVPFVHSPASTIGVGWLDVERDRQPRRV